MWAMSLLFSVHGRIGRSTYWLKFCLPYLAIHLLLLAADWRLGTVDPDEKTVGLLSGIFVAVALYSSILWPFIELGFLAGTDGPNGYGNPE